MSGKHSGFSGRVMAKGLYLVSYGLWDRQSTATGGQEFSNWPIDGAKNWLFAQTEIVERPAATAEAQAG